MNTTATTNVYCLISTSEKNHLELAKNQFSKLENTQIAEITNANCKRVLIFIDNNWSYLVAYDKNTLMCTVSGMLFDKESYKWVGIHNT